MHRLSPPTQPAEWRSIFRSLLRECSYLPDPVARSAWQDYVRQRFRRYQEKPRTHIPEYVERLSKLHKEARHNLSVLRRANEGFTRPLENVLRYAYGRKGRRRRELLCQMLAVEPPQDSAALEALVRGPDPYTDKWEPPKILVQLLRAQNTNPYILQLTDRPRLRKLKPPIPERNAWGRKVPYKRRVNIRRKWFKKLLDVVMPLLPDSELQVLEGLVSGAIPWSPPKPRRVASSAAASHEAPKGEMVRKVLTDGPPKDQTFEAYVKGRPHTITRRFMIRLWRRISCSVPRLDVASPAGVFRFTWGDIKPPHELAHSVNGSSMDIFGDIDISDRDGTADHDTATDKRAVNPEA
ncbi:hypothetical protein BJX61DRAFT_431330 [Aspergillus egyptiacus]|nr:hypothetical protein BJX61DRAFT_431330 [Aspergillus egyptiacus]